VRAFPVLMVALGVVWFVVLAWRMRTPEPRRGAGRLGRPASPSPASRDRLASYAPTPLADEVEEWLRQR
jgi:hypothetical protein